MVTFTMFEEESREINRHLRRDQMCLSIASDTSGLSEDLHSSYASRTCVYKYKDEGRTFCLHSCFVCSLWRV